MNMNMQEVQSLVNFTEPHPPADYKRMIIERVRKKNNLLENIQYIYVSV